MSRKDKPQENETNFFIPMVDMMVSAIFIFIIIVMVLVLMIKEPTMAETPTEASDSSAAKGQDTPIKPSIIENVVANLTAEEILVNDINRDMLSKQGIDSTFDQESNIFDIRLKYKNPQGK